MQTINYVLVPTDAGQANIDVSFATFNLAKGQYETTPVNKIVKVIPDKHSSRSIVYGDIASSKTSITSPKLQKRKKVSSVILYLKKHPGGNVLIPLWLNNIILVIILFLLGPLLWIITELVYLKKRRVGNNPILQRRSNALKRKNSVIKAIIKTPLGRLPDAIQKEAVPYINDLKGYPPGTTADELSNKLKEKELSEYIKEANALSYMPNLNKNTSALKKNLVKILKKLSVIVIIGTILFSFSNETVANSDDSASKDLAISQLIAAYNSADFVKAEKICKEKYLPKTLQMLVGYIILETVIIKMEV